MYHTPQFLMSTSTSSGPSSFLLMLEKKKRNESCCFAGCGVGQPGPVELLVVVGLPGEGDPLIHVIDPSSDVDRLTEFAVASAYKN